MGSYGFRETVHCAGVTSVNINALKASKGISSIKNINALKASEGIHSIRTIQTMCSLELMAAFRVPHCRLSSRTSRYITWGMEEELQQLAKPSASILDHIAALTGIFSLQEYYQAWASTEIASSIQTVSWLGDLGDISTGCTSAFLLIFFSELGDKTFFIALVAFEVRAFLRCFTVFLVQIAVLGGSLLGTYVSEKVITYTGGILFLVFAAATLFEIFK